MTERTVICVISGERGKQNHQPRGLISICRNQSRKVGTILLEWVITKGGNYKHQISQTSRLYCTWRHTSSDDCCVMEIWISEQKEFWRSAAEYLCLWDGKWASDVRVRSEVRLQTWLKRRTNSNTIRRYIWEEAQKLQPAFWKRVTSHGTTAT